MRTSNPEGCGGTCDRFSSLSDEVAHEILSFLTIEEIARISVVSKRFRRLSLSAPYLFLNFSCTKISKVGNTLLNTDRFVSLLDGTTKLRRFVLKNVFLYSEDIIQVCNWTREAAEIDLSFVMFDKDCFSLQPSTFVRAIKLRLHGGNLKLPSFTTSFSSLQVLDIKSIKLPNNLPDKWVSSLFPVIKKLILEDVEDIKDLNISSSSLEFLSINRCTLRRVVVLAQRLQTLCVGSCNLLRYWLFKIYAPSLQNISWTANSYSFQGGFVCLKDSYHANIDAPRIKLLQFINNAKSVTVGANILQVLLAEDLIGHSLDNVQNLDMQVSCKENYRVPALAFLFGRLHNLKTLTIRCIDRETFGCDGSKVLLALETRDFNIDMEYWKSQDVAFIHQLKEVKIEIRKWGCEVGLVKYLIKHAKALDKMIVTFSSNIDTSIKRLICKKLLEFYKASPIATLDFVLK
ncbi:uncharacterized protein LOC132273179 [Cornus florida]|uniref:uncharacterized protein LOC132273179 n=1 Tax=Cornus florida TaxID=4283 RepID=UPI002899A4A1|nr:uncharacterized protein LOC132273179 [Cornus florida]